jgi:hypothetical protein
MGCQKNWMFFDTWRYSRGWCLYTGLLLLKFLFIDRIFLTHKYLDIKNSFIIQSSRSKDVEPFYINSRRNCASLVGFHLQLLKRLLYWALGFWSVLAFLQMRLRTKIRLSTTKFAVTVSLSVMSAWQIGFQKRYFRFLVYFSVFQPLLFTPKGMMQKFVLGTHKKKYVGL